MELKIKKIDFAQGLKISFGNPDRDITSVTTLRVCPPEIKDMLQELAHLFNYLAYESGEYIPYLFAYQVVKKGTERMEMQFEFKHKLNNIEFVAKSFWEAVPKELTHDLPTLYTKMYLIYQIHLQIEHWIGDNIHRIFPRDNQTSLFDYIMEGKVEVTTGKVEVENE